METITKTLLFFLIINTLGAQGYSTDKFSGFNNYQDIQITKVVVLSNTAKIGLEPTFAGLFQKKFNQSIMTIKWQHIYDDYNAGLKISLHKQLARKLLLQINYQWGLLKFNNQIVGEAPGYSTSLAFKYNF